MNIEILSSWVYLSLATSIMILLIIIHNHKCKVVEDEDVVIVKALLKHENVVDKIEILNGIKNKYDVIAHTHYDPEEKEKALIKYFTYCAWEKILIEELNHSYFKLGRKRGGSNG